MGRSRQKHSLNIKTRAPRIEATLSLELTALLFLLRFWSAASVTWFCCGSSMSKVLFCSDGEKQSETQPKHKSQSPDRCAHGVLHNWGPLFTRYIKEFWCILFWFFMNQTSSTHNSRDDSDCPSKGDVVLQCHQDTMVLQFPIIVGLYQIFRECQTVSTPLVH